jgi:hypothetical protein
VFRLGTEGRADSKTLERLKVSSLFDTTEVEQGEGLESRSGKLCYVSKGQIPKGLTLNEGEII